MNRNFPAHKDKAITQLRSRRLASNIRHSQASSSSSEITTKRRKDNKASILKNTNNKKYQSSHIRHCNIPIELFDSMVEQKLESLLSMPEHDLKMNEEETTITYISFPIYQAHIIGPILFYVDTGAPHSCIREKALKTIVHHSGRKCILIIDYKRDFKLGDTLIRSRSMIELMLPTSGSPLQISVILEVVDVEIPALLRIDVLDGKTFLSKT